MIDGSIRKTKTRATIVFIMITLFLFYKYALEVSPDILNQVWQQQLHITAAQFGLIAASYYYAYGLLQLPIGVITDRCGVRNVIVTGILTCALGAFLIAHAQNAWHAEVSRFVIGLGAACAFVCGMKIITQWFNPKHFALLVGIFIMLGILGGVGGHAPLAIFLNKMGWRHGLALCAGAGVVLAAAMWFTLGRSTPQAKNFEQTHIVKHLSQLFKNKQSWMVSIYSGMMFAPLIVLGGAYGVSTLKSIYHVSAMHAGNISQFSFLGFALCAPVVGWFSDKIKRRLPTMILGPVLALFILAAIGMKIIAIAWLPLATFGFGFFLGGFLPCFAFIKEVNPLAFSGAAIGLMNTFEAIFSGLSDDLVSRVPTFWPQSSSWGSAHQGIYFFLVIELLAGLLFLLGLKETHCKQKV